MAQLVPRLPYPNGDLIARYCQDYDQTQVVVERALTKLFAWLPDNTNPEDVLLKVVALNDLYRTGILATGQVAEHIVKSNIDALLRAGAAEVVDVITPVRLGSKVRRNYSFASKYCAWHESDAYPIFDSYVERMLWSYQQQDHFSSFKQQDLRQYVSFKTAIEHFRAHYQLGAFSLKDIDKFLWLAGKEVFPVNW